MKLSIEEKYFLDKICAVSSKDKNTVKDVLKALLMCTTIEIYADSKEMVIPYMCKLKIDYMDNYKEDKHSVVVHLEATPCEGLINEIAAIQEGGITPTQEYIQKMILFDLKNKLEIEDIEE